MAERAPWLDNISKLRRGGEMPGSRRAREERAICDGGIAKPMAAEPAARRRAVAPARAWIAGRRPRKGSAPAIGSNILLGRRTLRESTVRESYSSQDRLEDWELIVE